MEATILELCRDRYLTLAELAELLNRAEQNLRNKYLTPMVRAGKLRFRYQVRQIALTKLTPQLISDPTESLARVCSPLQTTVRLLIALDSNQPTLALTYTAAMGNSRVTCPILRPSRAWCLP